MAINTTLLAAADTGISSASHSLAAVTLTANRLQSIQIRSTKSAAGTASTPTIADVGGRHWVQVADVLIPGGTTNRLTTFRSMAPTTDAAVVIVVDYGGVLHACRYGIIESDGVNTSGSDGAGAVGATATNTGTGTTASTAQSFAGAGSGCIAAVAHDSNSAITQEAGWTELYEVNTRHQGMWRADNDTTPSATIAASVNWAMVSTELLPPVPTGRWSTFNGSEDPLSEGSTWTSGLGATSDYKKVSGIATPTTGAAWCSAQYVGMAFGANQYSEITLTGSGAQMGPIVRQQPADAGCYYCDFDNGNTIKIYRVVDSGSLAFTQLGANITPGVWVTGDRLRLEVTGTTLNVYKNNVLLDTRTDATFASGQPGIWGITTSAIGITDWRGGDLAVYALAAALAGVGALAAAAVRKVNAATTLAGIGALTATATRKVRATATLAGVGALAAAATSRQGLRATLTGVGTLLANARLIPAPRVTVVPGGGSPQQTAAVVEDGIRVEVF